MYSLMSLQICMTFSFLNMEAFIFHIMKADGDWSGPALKMAKKVSESS